MQDANSTDLTPEDVTHDPEAPAAKPSLAGARRLFALARPFAGLLVLTSGLILLSTGFSLALPLIARAALDHVLRTRQVAVLDRLGLALVGLILLWGLVAWAQSLLIVHLGNRIVLDLRARLFAHLQRLPVAFFDRTRSGDLASRLASDVTLLQNILTWDVVGVAGNVATLVGGAAIALVIDWRLTAAALALIAALAAVYLVVGRRLRALSRTQQDALADGMGAMTEALGNVRLVKAFARERHEDARVGTKLARVYGLALRRGVVESALHTFGSVGFTGILLGVVWYSGRAVLAGQLSVGSLLAFLLTITIIAGPIEALGGLYVRLQQAIGAADRLFEILDTPPEPPDPPHARAFPDGPGAVTFENVVFAYTPDVPVLRGLSLDAPPGRVTALVGPSGAGKTTLTLLLYRFYEPQGGVICIDGVPVGEIARDALREGIGLVPQEPVLFTGTLRENIRYGRLDATDAEVEAAARAANVHEFAEPLPDRYETLVGERGITLSGGQRQRVAIARALLKNPRLLLLDEATSALDNASEALVREALDRLLEGRTTLVIAHRLSTIRNAHRIAVVDGGRVVERGTHEELLRQADGRYAALYRSAAGPDV
uniref:Efflux ABC transporter, permease/ATP-binding protein n=1 Tax=uncultured Armatimonadetes bacterium TaxID=157466 RepID=A0A6J4HM01_9BACT|nr:Efflux ABC transporter, permease/ATP-binding protein [uncultured Armatimonadetes bacterium]